MAKPDPAGSSDALEALVLKVAEQTARVRELRTGEEITLRTSSIDVSEVVPGAIVTVQVSRRWSHHRNAYASGRIQSARIDVPALGLAPLRLEHLGPIDADDGEPYEEPRGLAALWQRIVAVPRDAYEMEQVLAGHDLEADFCPIVDASERRQAGDRAGASKALMDLLLQDLRCLDAHAHLGNWAFESSFDFRLEQALQHYEVGVRIGEQALGTDFEGMLPWSCIDNRPFLRCLHGYACTLWRLGRMKDAERAFERMLWHNPWDNQGARFCWLDVRAGNAWQPD